MPDIAAYSETEEKIFLAALEEFSRNGRQGARLQDIADRAGINKALIHYYFRSKDRLYNDVFTFVIRRYFLQMGETIRPGDSFETTLRDFVDRYIDLLDENPALPFFILRDIAEGAPMMSEKVGEVLLPHAGNIPHRFTESCERAARDGEIRPIDSVQTLITVMGACIYFFAGYPVLSAAIPRLKRQRRRFLRERKQHIVDIVYYGLKPRPEESE